MAELSGKNLTAAELQRERNSRRVTVAFECGAAGLHLYKSYEQEKKKSSQEQVIIFF